MRPHPPLPHTLTTAHPRQPTDTFVGYRRLGYNVVICTLAMIIIHSSCECVCMHVHARGMRRAIDRPLIPPCLKVAWWSQDHWWPDPTLRIHLKNIHRTK